MPELAVALAQVLGASLLLVHTPRMIRATGRRANDALMVVVCRAMLVSIAVGLTASNLAFEVEQ